MECDCFNFKQDYQVLREYTYWKLYLAESQHIIGWSHAVLKRHIEFFEDLSDEELSELKEIIRDLKKALNQTFQPDWFNVMQLGNMTKHLHFQLVPRYKDERTFEGRTFIDDQYGKMLAHRWEPENDEFLKKLVDYIKQHL